MTTSPPISPECLSMKRGGSSRLFLHHQGLALRLQLSEPRLPPIPPNHYHNCLKTSLSCLHLFVSVPLFPPPSFLGHTSPPQPSRQQYRHQQTAASPSVKKNRMKMRILPLMWEVETSSPIAPSSPSLLPKDSAPTACRKTHIPPNKQSRKTPRPRY